MGHHSTCYTPSGKLNRIAGEDPTAATSLMRPSYIIMSKKVEDSELQTLTLSPTNTNDDESSPFVNPASDETAFPISPPPSYSSVTTSSSTLTGEKRKLERMVSAPSSSTTKPVPAVRVSTPPGSSRITYTNERANDRKMDLSKIIRERPTPSSSIGQKKAAHNTPGTPGHEGPPPSPGIRRFVVNAPEGKNTNWMQSFGSQWVTGEPQKSYDGNDVTSTFGPNPITSSTPVTSMSLLTLPPSRGTPNMQRSVTSRGGLGRPGMMRSGPRSVSGIDARKMDRPVQHHTFMADVADVRQIEQGLLQLMEDFQAGSLRAFGKDSRLRQMEAIREQQERLARLHFEVGAEQDLYPPLSEDGLRASHNSMRTLMEKLAQLSESIERLHTNTSSSERKSVQSHLFNQRSTTDPTSSAAASKPHYHHHHSHHHHGHHHSHHHHHHHHHHNSSHNAPNSTASTVTDSLGSSQQTTPTNSHNVTGSSTSSVPTAPHQHQPSPGNTRPSQTLPPVPLRLKGPAGSHFGVLSKAGKVGDS
ncbi:lateral signaling target protein 2 homolog isoform X1 [Eriocheir sinensis]|uniref:lateral signaling target protein 2 homolog isoform X1 n=3 Tax=Eriocheir sinensis TaxID=95602 RepID=UPI0021C76C29|nr:lateral signaling target protein 2 homolog isoform X1 [Eriocheir sinensis]